MATFYQDFNNFLTFMFSTITQILNFLTSNLLGELVLFIIFVSLFFLLIERIRGD